MSGKVCQAIGCRKWLKGRQRKFCSEQCNTRTWAQKQRDGNDVPVKTDNQESKSDSGDYA